MGWGTVLDVTYAGSQTQNIEVTYELSTTCRMAPTSSTSTRRTSTRATGRPCCRPTSCGPIAGIGTIGVRQNTGDTRLQLDAGAAESPLHQRPAVRARLHAGQGYDSADHQPVSRRTGLVLERAPTGGTQLHNLTVSYTWDVPDGSRLWNNSLTRGALDGWQLSGNTAFVSGDWAGVTFTTTDNFDFYGGGGPAGVIVTDGAADDPAIRAADNRDPNAGRHRLVSELDAFARPAGRLRSRQRRGAVLPAAAGSGTPTCRCSRTSSSAAAGGCSSAGRSTTCSTR